MIITEAELRAALGLTPTISAQQNMHIQLAMQLAHAGIRQFLRYDPEQKEGPAEFYPRIDTSRNYGSDYTWDVTAAMTRAIYEDRGRERRYLQLARLPVRSVTSIYVDIAARFGTQSEDFTSQMQLTQGTDFAPEFDQENLCLSGCLISYTGWPTAVGTVKVTYRAGYSPLEFTGPQMSNSTDSDGNVTRAGVDASPIKSACLMAALAQFHTMQAFGTNAVGLIATGPKQSETLGSYSYSLADGAWAAAIAGMKVSLPSQSQMLLENFVNYGIELAA